MNPNSNFETDVNVREDNPNYFSPAWVHGNYPDQLSCDSVSGCSVFGNDCLCIVTISETAVFLALPPTTADIISELKIGGVDVEAADGYTILASTSDFDVYQKDAGGYDKETVFKILNHFGEEAFFKNMVSMVEIGHIDSEHFSFRNPVQFLNPARREGRDAQYETDAVLKHYVRHPNTAPFLAQRMIQRFGTSNPAPSYVEAVAIAFKEGTYSSENVLFGDGMYGSLEAMIAAIVLHDEARSVVLDADPTSGALREPVSCLYRDILLHYFLTFLGLIISSTLFCLFLAAENDCLYEGYGIFNQSQNTRTSPSEFRIKDWANGTQQPQRI